MQVDAVAGALLVATRFQVIRLSGALMGTQDETGWPLSNSDQSVVSDGSKDIVLLHTHEGPNEQYGIYMSRSSCPKKIKATCEETADDTLDYSLDSGETFTSLTIDSWFGRERGEGASHFTSREFYIMTSVPGEDKHIKFPMRHCWGMLIAMEPHPTGLFLFLSQELKLSTWEHFPEFTKALTWGRRGLSSTQSHSCRWE